MQNFTHTEWRLLMRRKVIILLTAFTLFIFGGVNMAIAQDQKSAVRERVQQELSRQGIMPEQAEQQARQLGFDPANPPANVQEAARQARFLGIPESQIQEALDAFEQQQVEAVPEADAEQLDDGTVAEDDAAESEEDEAMSEEEEEEELPSEEDSIARATLPYFGYDVFRNIPDAFKPSSNGPVGEGYVIDRGDVLRLTLWGASEFYGELSVDNEGRIYMENAGQLMVAGRRLDDLREDVKTWLSRIHAGLVDDSPTIRMDLTVARVRPIYVYVLGEVERPGGYELPSNSLLFNALYSVDGIKTSGSLRDIRIIHGSSMERDTIDVYDYLMEGYIENEIRLRDSDRILIPPRGKTVAITGTVRRPAFYELLDDEGFSALLKYAGGLIPEAYTKRLQIERIIPPAERTDPSVAREVLDVPMQEVLSGERDIPLVDGDRVRILSILDILRNSVAISGAVFQPGQYELGDSVRTVRDLIMQADSVTGDAYWDKAELIRVNDDGTERLISLNLHDVFADSLSNIPLLPLDDLRVYSVHELETGQLVYINGTVRNPGARVLRDSMTVYDLLFSGGGLVDSVFLQGVYLERADLVRETPDGKRQHVIPFHLGEALAGRDMADLPLYPKDAIRIYPKHLDETVVNEYITVSGAVKNPGQYPLQDNMTLADLIVRTGGFAEGADVTQAEIGRMGVGLEPRNGNTISEVVMVPLAQTRDTLSFALDDTVRMSREAKAFLLSHRDLVYVRTDPTYRSQQTVTVTGEVYYPGEYPLEFDNETLSNLIARAGGIRPTGYPKGGRLVRQGNPLIISVDEAIRNPRADIILQLGDNIIIPPKPNTVAIRGNVMNEGLVKYESGRRVSHYLEQVGGTRDDTETILLTQANGSTYNLDRWWPLPNKNPKVDDGAVIVVIREPPKEETVFNLGETITNTVSVVTSALTAFVLIDRWLQ